MLKRSEYASEIEKLLRDEVSYGEDIPADRDVDLFAGGYLDSAAAITLAVALEERYGIRIDDEDVFDPKFVSINGLAALVAERREATAE